VEWQTRILAQFAAANVSEEAVKKASEVRLLPKSSENSTEQLSGAGAQVGAFESFQYAYTRGKR
jgi:hypothetical protein